MRTTQSIYDQIRIARVTNGSYTRSDTGGAYPYSVVDKIDVSLKDGGVFSKDPEWKVLVATRKDASGAYFRRRIAFRPRPVNVSAMYYWPGPAAWFNYTGTYIAGDDPTYPTLYVQEQDDPSLRDLALARLKRKMSSRSNQMNIIVPVVELREFRGLITALTFATTDLVESLIRAKKSKSPKAFLQFMSHAWLNYSFALSPTLSDIKQLGDTINDIIAERGGDMFTEYGAAKKEWQYVSPKIRRPTSYVGGSDVRFIGRNSLSYRFVSGFQTPLRSANDYSIRGDFSLEIGALVPTLWELTAFSWLADYFTTFGDYLEDTFVTDQTNSVYVNCTKKYSCRGYWDVSKPLGSGVTGTGGGSSTELDWTVVDRTVYSSLPSRALRFKTADEIGKNAMNKLLNLGSILVGGRALSNKY